MEFLIFLFKFGQKRMKKTFYFIGLIPAVFLAQEKKDSVKVTEIKEVSIIKKQPVAQTLKGYH